MDHRGFLLFDHAWAGETRPYAVYLPKSWDGETPLPTILYLHGSGESGTDGVRQLLIGLPHAILNASHRWPFLVIAPQKLGTGSEWYDQREWLAGVLETVERDFPVDKSRCYLTGLSQGGRGTFRLVKSLPWEFAAAAPVCGWVDPDEAADNFRETPLWAFHGDADDVVSVTGSTNAVEAVVQGGGDAQLTVYGGVGHNSWDLAYASALPEWLLSHKL